MIDFRGWWDQIEREAKDAPDPPMVPGEPIAWSIGLHGKTDGLSAVHILADDGKTCCGQELPGPLSLLRLSPRLIHAMDECWVCGDSWGTRRQ